MKPGYKQTEVGVIPEDWEVLQLGDLISYTKGFPFKSSEYQSTGIRVVRVSDTTYDSIKAEDPIYVSESSVNRYANWQLKDHDLVVSTVGSKPPLYDSMVGKVILIDQSHENALLNQNAVLLRDRKRRAYVMRLLLNHLRTKRYLLHIEAIYRGNANQASITLKELFQFRMSLPSDDSEQRLIAEALSDVDGLLGGLDRLIAKKRDLKQAAMQQLLTGQTRLPGFHGEWEVKTLRSVFEIMAGKSMSAYISDGGDFVICDMGSVSTEGRLIKTKRTNYRGDFLREGDLVMPKDDIGGGKIIGRVGYVDCSELYVLGDHVYRLRAIEGDPLFLSYLINSHSIISALRKKVIGSAQLGLGRRSVEEQEIPFPPLPEQTAIAQILSDMDAELTALEQRREKTRALKQAMMQELLTGRTRLV